MLKMTRLAMLAAALALAAPVALASAFEATNVEALGSVRRAMSIIKKRTGMHESTIREYRIDDRGLTIGEPLDGFQGILRGVPIYIGEGQPLLQEPSA